MQSVSLSQAGESPQLHSPILQLSVIDGLHALSHSPQFDMLFEMPVSQPSAESALQSAKSSRQTLVQDDGASHRGAEFGGVLQAFPHEPQDIGELRSVSQPGTAASQSSNPSSQTTTHVPRSQDAD